MKTRDRQVVHLCDAVVVIVVHLGGRNAGQSTWAAGVAVIWVPLALFVGALRHQVVEQDLLVLQDLPLQVFDRAVVSLLLRWLLARGLLLLAT